MPMWLTTVCTVAILASCVYLLFVILRPERF